MKTRMDVVHMAMSENEYFDLVINGAPVGMVSVEQVVTHSCKDSKVKTHRITLLCVDGDIIGNSDVGPMSMVTPVKAPFNYEDDVDADTDADTNTDTDADTHGQRHRKT